MIDYSKAARLAASAKSAERGKPIGGSTTLYDRGDHYLVEMYGSELMRIYPDRWLIREIGSTLTVVRRIKEISPLGQMWAYTRQGTLYFGRPTGRYSLPSDGSWVEISLSGEVSGAGPHDPTAEFGWIDGLSRLYAAALGVWASQQGRLPSREAEEPVSPPEIAELMCAREMSADVLWDGVGYKVSRRNLPAIVDSLEREIHTDPQAAAIQIAKAVYPSIIRGRKEMTPTVVDCVVKGGMPPYRFAEEQIAKML